MNLARYPGHDFEAALGTGGRNERRCPDESNDIFFPEEGEPVRLPFRPGRWTVEKIKTILEKSGVEKQIVMRVPPRENGRRTTARRAGRSTLSFRSV